MDINWWERHIVDLSPYYQFQENSIHLLDLSKVHPIISGNKFYKLYGYLKQYEISKFKGIVSMGSAHSNHLHALSFYCFLHNIPLYTFVRKFDNENLKFTPTLMDIKKWNTNIIPLSAHEYRKLRKEERWTEFLNVNNELLWIPEGGRGEMADLGIQKILNPIIKNYKQIWINVGSAASLAAIFQIENLQQQEFVGVAPFKKIKEQEEYLIKKNVHNYNFKLFKNPWNINFGQITDEVYDFVKKMEQKFPVRLDYIYTSSLFKVFEDFILEKQIVNKKFPILLIHGGGLQGNRTYERS